MAPLAVVKIGGSLLRDPATLSEVAAALAGRRGQGPLLVVVSAFQGVTDQLRLAAFLAPDRHGAGPASILEKLRIRHGELAGAGGGTAAILAEVEELLSRVRRSGTLGEGALARVLASGEKLSVGILAAALAARGLAARAASAEEIGLRARGRRLSGECDLAASRAALARLRRRLRREVVVVTGFYGVDREGAPILFGRGGSDYSAGALAAGLGAGRLELWKDVGALLSADPRRVPQARRVPRVSFVEAACLAASGAELLHPRCLEPIGESRVRVLLRPLACGPGTRLSRLGGRPPGRAAALAVRSGCSVLCLPKVVGPVLAGRILARLVEAAVPFTRSSASGRPLELSLRPVDLPRALAALGGLGGPGGRWPLPFSVRHQRARITLVGDQVAAGATPGRVLDLLRDLGLTDARLRARAGSLALRCSVAEAELGATLEALHDLLFPTAARQRDEGSTELRADSHARRSRSAQHRIRLIQQPSREARASI